jgi:hypothetical protein
VKEETTPYGDGEAGLTLTSQTQYNVYGQPLWIENTDGSTVTMSYSPHQGLLAEEVVYPKGEAQDSHVAVVSGVMPQYEDNTIIENPLNPGYYVVSETTYGYECPVSECGQQSQRLQAAGYIKEPVYSETIQYNAYNQPIAVEKRYATGAPSALVHGNILAATTKTEYEGPLTAAQAEDVDRWIPASIRPSASTLVGSRVTVVTEGGAVKSGQAGVSHTVEIHSGVSGETMYTLSNLQSDGTYLRGERAFYDGLGNAILSEDDHGFVSVVQYCNPRVTNLTPFGACSD